jgi:hypothetical protein
MGAGAIKISKLNLLAPTYTHKKHLRYMWSSKLFSEKKRWEVHVGIKEAENRSNKFREKFLQKFPKCFLLDRKLMRFAALSITD